jgi:AcrR family transcriptional regulator
MKATRQQTVPVIAGAADDTPPIVDGRTLRRTRNRTAVITALLELIREGDLHPAAADIADRAGVSHRSIFRYFDDLDDLVRTTIDLAFREAEPFGRISDLGQGTFEERVARFVDARLRLFEHIDGTMQVARMRAYSIPSIDEEIAAICEFSRVQIRRHFAEELATCPHPQNDFVVDAVLVLASYDSYTIHTRLLASSVGRIRAAWTTALYALLRPCPTA